MDFFARLEAHVKTKGNDEYCVWLDNSCKVAGRRTFKQVVSNAQLIARHLQAGGVKPDDRVVLCYNFGLEFLDVFLGCMFCQATPVPLYPPNPNDMEKSLGKLKLVLENSGSQLVLLGKDVETLRRTSRASWPDTCSYKVLPTFDGKLFTSFDADPVCSPSLDAPAFIQYTSGSTGDPKGVVLTYRNLLANFDLMRLSYVRDGTAGSPEEIVHCSWYSDARCSAHACGLQRAVELNAGSLCRLPQFHDLGLIHATLWPLYCGARGVYFSPSSFIKNPLLWLQAMSVFKCTTTAAPNFAYGLAARRMAELREGSRPVLDLSAASLWTCAAEPNRPETLQHFAETFRSSGLRGGFNLSYGIAEHTVFVSAFVVPIFAEHRRPMEEVLTDSTGQFVACGRLQYLEEHVDLRVVDAERRQPLPDGARGEVWVRSSSAATSYWGMPERSDETFAAKLEANHEPLPALEDATGACTRSAFMRTGDEGVIETHPDTGDRVLFFCGRIKDMIIIRGKNLFPQDLERAAELTLSEIRPNCSAAFQARGSDGADLQAIDLVCELRSTGLAFEVKEGMAKEVARRLRAEFSVAVHKLLFIRPRSIPKTTSGKIQRRATQQALAGGTLLKHALLVWHDLSSGQARDRDGQEEAADDEARESDVLERIVEELEEMTGSEVDADAALFELGLDSLMTAELCQSLSLSLRRPVEPHDVLAAPTLRALLAALTASPEGEASAVDAKGEARLAAARKGSSEPSAVGSAPRPTPPGPSRDGRNQPAASLRGQSHGDADGRPKRAGGSRTLGACACNCVAQVLCFAAVLVAVAACLVPAGVVFERLAHENAFRGLRVFRYRVEPVLEGDVRLHARVNGAVVALLGPAAARAPGGVYWSTALAMIAAGATLLVSLLAGVVLVKWALLCRAAPGPRPLWGWFYWRRWMVQQLAGLVLSAVSVACPDGGVLGALYWCLGARVGKDCRIRCVITQDWDMLHFGDGVSVSGSAALVAGVVSGGVLHTGPISLGAGCEVGEKAAVVLGTSLPPCTLVSNHCVVSPATAVPPDGRCVLHGKPAAVLQGAGERGVAEYAGSPRSSALERAGFPLCWAATLCGSSCACLGPVLVLDQEVWGGSMASWVLPLRLLATMAVFWLTFGALTVLCKWLLLGRMGKGTRVPANSWLRLRREMVHRMADLSFRVIWNRTCFSELQCGWFRLLGASIAQGVILGGSVNMRDWDSVKIGPRVLLGGGAQLMTASKSADGSTEVIEGVEVEADAMLGSDAIVPAGCTVGQHAVVGSRSWVLQGAGVAEFSVVVGSKQRAPTQRAFVPGEARPQRRGSAWGVLLAICLFAAGTYGSMLAVLWVGWALGDSLTGLVLLWPAVVLTLSGGVIAWTLVGKWVCMGRFWEGTYRMEGAYGLRYLCVMHLLRHGLLFNPLSQWLRGGPLANLVLRGLGAKVSMHAYINSLAFFEHDLVTVEPGAVVSDGVTVACHCIVDTFECSLGPISIGEGACLWPGSIIFGHRSLPPFHHLGPQSVMSHNVTDAQGDHDHDQCVSVMMGVPAAEVVTVPLAPRPVTV